MRKQHTRWVLAALLALALPALALGNRVQAKRLQEMQELWAKSIRWGEYDTALALVDPQVRGQHSLSDLERTRYQQVEVSGYSEVTSQVDANGVVARVVELRVINRNTMGERTSRYTEHWRWDDRAKRWWNMDGLPDLWNHS